VRLMLEAVSERVETLRAVMMMARAPASAKASAMPYSSYDQRATDLLENLRVYLYLLTHP